jgi:hypothetical protein
VLVPVLVPSVVTPVIVDSPVGSPLVGPLVGPPVGPLADPSVAAPSVAAEVGPVAAEVGPEELEAPVVIPVDEAVPVPAGPSPQPKTVSDAPRRPRQRAARRARGERTDPAACEVLSVPDERALWLARRSPRPAPRSSGVCGPLFDIAPILALSPARGYRYEG